MLEAQALERRNRLQQLSQNQGLSPEATTHLDTPAYLRRGQKLEPVAPSNTQHISRFNLSDDNELLGDNRFLHDNVD
jgi:cell division protein FtsZ